MKRTLFLITISLFLFITAGCDVSQDTSDEYTSVVEDTAAVIASSYSTASYDDLAVMEEAVATVNPDGDCICDQECDQTCDQDCNQTCEHECECECSHRGVPAPGMPHHRYMNGSDRNGSAEITFTVAYYDIDGNLQDAYDAFTTEKVEWSDSFTSVLENPVMEKSVSRTHQFAITGLNGENETLIINGTGTAVKTAVMTHPADTFTRTYSMTWSKTYGDVVWSTDRETYPYPLSGTIHIVINVEKTFTTTEGEKTRTFSLDAVITFNGTCSPELVIDSDRTFTINITDGTAAEE